MSERDRRRGVAKTHDGVWTDAKRVFELPPAEDVRREMAFHIAMKTEALMAKGWSREAARAEAERTFGDAGEVEAECVAIASRQRRSAIRAWRLDTLWQDIRFGARVLMRRPGFAAVSALTLALGIGANAAVFSVIQNVLLAPLPYADQQRIVTLWEVSRSGVNNGVAEPNYFDWKRDARTFESMAAYRGPSVDAILGGREPVRRPISIVTGEFFGVMRGEAEVGRLPDPAEVTAGAPPIAIVSRRFWSSVLGGERELDRLSLSILGYSVPVVAVMPDGFDFPVGTDVWIALAADAGGTRTSHNYEVVARIAPTSSLRAARQEMDRIGERLAREYAGEIDAMTVRVVPLAEDLYGSYRRPLILLLAAAAAVLLVACTNLASALLARSAAREREVAVRASVGASRGRIARQLMTESVLLALIGALLGLGLAVAVLSIARSIEPSGLLRLREPGIGLPVFGFTLVAALAASMLFGLVPALRSTGVDTASLLRSGDRGGTGGRHSRLWDALVVAEVALALVLLVVSGLLVRSFREIVKVDEGFDTRDVAVVDVFIPSAVHPGDTAVAMIATRLLEAFARVPGVDAVGLTNLLPGRSGLNGRVDLEDATESGNAEYRVASEGYFEALRVPLLSGRMFDANDVMGSAPVVLVDEAFAQRHFPGGNAVGRRIRNLRNDSFHYGDTEWLTIVGVVGSVQPHGQLHGADPTVYVLYRQRPFRARYATFTLRLAGGGQAGMTGSVRDAMAGIAPDVPWEIGLAAERIDAPLAGRRFAMLVISGFAVLTLILAAVGIHGVVSWSVQRRTREMGIRVALGAAPYGVAGRIIADAMIVVATGLLAGAVVAVMAGRLVNGFLVEVDAADPLTILGVTALLAMVALAACALPSLRVTRIDPMISLRSE